MEIKEYLSNIYIRYLKQCVNIALVDREDLRILNHKVKYLKISGRPHKRDMNIQGVNTKEELLDTEIRIINKLIDNHKAGFLNEEEFNDYILQHKNSR